MSKLFNKHNKRKTSQYDRCNSVTGQAVSYECFIYHVFQIFAKLDVVVIINRPVIGPHQRSFVHYWTFNLEKPLFCLLMLYFYFIFLFFLQMYCIYSTTLCLFNVLLGISEAFTCSRGKLGFHFEICWRLFFFVVPTTL